MQVGITEKFSGMQFLAALALFFVFASTIGFATNWFIKAIGGGMWIEVLVLTVMLVVSVILMPRINFDQLSAVRFFLFLSGLGLVALVASTILPQLSDVFGIFLFSGEIITGLDIILMFIPAIFYISLTEWVWSLTK